MKLKKICSLLLAVTLVGTTLVGCQSEKNETVSTENVSSETEEVVVESITSFTYWLPMATDINAYYVDYNDHPATILLEEESGLEVEYISPPIGQEDTQFNLLLASPDELPDLIKYDIDAYYKGGVSAAIEDGVIIDATELIEEYAPNFMAYVNSSEEMQKGAYSDEGVLIKFGAIIADDGMSGVAFSGPVVDQTELDKAGLDIPVTIADWEEMLAAFKEQGVEYPFSFGANNTLAQNSLYDAFASAYGVAAGPRFINVDGEIKFSPLEDGYKEWIELFNKWYENGWLDPDFLGKSLNSEIKDDLNLGKIGSTVTHANTMTTASTLSEQAGVEIVDAQPAPYPVVNEGDQIHLRHNTESYNSTPVYITTNAEDPISIIKWMDYFYSEEGIVATNWGMMGIEGYEDTYYVDDDGLKQRTEILTGDKTDDGPIYYLNRFTTVWEWDFQLRMYHPQEIKEVSREVWGEADTAYNLPATLSLTAEESEAYGKIQQDLDTYVIEMTSKFILGKEPMENYDEFIETIKEMNAEEAIAIYQAALDRYNER